MEEWLNRLQEEDVEAAWDLFVTRYRRLIFATIRHHSQDHDEVMDLFADVCAALREDGMARLRRYSRPETHRARFSTWLVVVVRHLVIDRLRAVHGRRRRPAAADRLPPVQRRIYDLVFLRGNGHREAYEVISASEGGLRFGSFLRELAAVYRVIPPGADPRTRHGMQGADPLVLPASAEVAERQRVDILERSLVALPELDAAVLRLYVMEGLPAADVARLLDLPDTKAVYNRVYRALAVLRSRLRELGYEHAGDI